jgi:hypothetical protein
MQAPIGVVALLLVFASACAKDSVGITAISRDVADASPRFSAWTSAVNMGTPVNTTEAENGPFISRDGLSLYFSATRQGSASASDFDIYVSRRADTDAPWGPPEALGPLINTPANEGGPTLSPDGHRLYFASARVGGLGERDLYVSRRHDKRDDFGWQAPVSLGDAVNTPANEDSPTLVEDEGAGGTITLYFDSNRPGRGDSDIYMSVMLADDSFGPAMRVEELSTAAREIQPVIRRDGLEAIFVSNRLTGRGMADLWVSTRASTSDAWGTPVNLGSSLNTTFVDGGPALSSDGRTLYFHSNANRMGGTGPCFGDPGPCFFDLYVATRSKLK